MAVLADSFEPLHYAFGATIAIKSKVLEEIGGFESIKDLLADDFHLGKRAVERGYRIALSRALVTIVPGERTFSRLLASSTALGAHLSHRPSDKRGHDPDARTILGPDTDDCLRL